VDEEKKNLKNINKNRVEGGGKKQFAESWGEAAC